MKNRTADFDSMTTEKTAEADELAELFREDNIEKFLARGEELARDKEEIERIIKESVNLEGLSPEEAAALLQIEEREMLELMLQTARQVKETIYGKRLVLFAPLYFDNICDNKCLYCAFRQGNDEVERRRLSQEEIKKEVEALIEKGHKRLLVLTGERENEDLTYLLEGIRTAYETGTEAGEIRRINVEVAPLTVEEFSQLDELGIGTYTCFQETYHRPTYDRLHPSGPKSDYDWRLSVMDRAIEGGIDDYGIGALFGLYDYRFEVISLLLHANYLQERYGVGPHTISVPRLNMAAGAPLDNPPAPVSDFQFKKLVAVLRLAVPYTGIILSTREEESLRDQLFRHGVSQISAGSRTSPGGYEEARQRDSKEEQFSLHDTRPIAEIIYELAEKNYLPSFCTACYRKGRTGEDFMDLARPGKIQQYCKPNAMMTFKEYLEDFAGDELQERGESCLEHHLDEMKENNSDLAGRIKERLNKIGRGERDIYL
ncbi:[FeFe] hydrogenase H-cluster radical SAM maturase HydG [Halarsenatibacter silvermanii]|uniref:Iron-only hydrogenase maturation protein HydG n=1 Tax=Halarsenatibacter silvermanii TaxID=321763 RepID=A0A1G9KQ67_9FIRM|nr:[FeFe] hydrogenase H-cluster radical SAM maturase HydG [Halarsenatibacter silvermanii]SDL51862.1 iron-only hydrogenase maturation protein HydG [Halarsenatibacter silvermanii]